MRIDDLQSAIPLERSLVKGGLKTIEITLRTPNALNAIKAITQEVPESIFGAGTILISEQEQFSFRSRNNPQPYTL
ncbi:hypothetical protein [Bartonella quintana]|uniref:hypothetical protein n=1 Tax=Bartonella quintana TaxID=803 RepID=UPI0004B28E9A